MALNAAAAAADPLQTDAGRRVRYVLRDDLPAGRLTLPILTDDGRLVIAVKAGEMSTALLDELNEFADYLLTCGFAEMREGRSRWQGPDAEVA
ncbi:hypothetical protein ACFW4X_10940 [Streptomyces smyrnaeus]|uniref:hypothetical protein n=1 Tax=Streptomyces smyrnaeus TaxID=1387713 RepID=UPI003685936A